MHHLVGDSGVSFESIMEAIMEPPPLTPFFPNRHNFIQTEASSITHQLESRLDKDDVVETYLDVHSVISDRQSNENYFFNQMKLFILRKNPYNSNFL